MLSGILNTDFLLRLAFIATGIFFLSGCGEEERMIPFTGTEMVRLLSGDTTKSWIRTSYVTVGDNSIDDDCELQTVTTYFIDELDSQRFFIRSNPDLCGGIADTLETGYWRIIGMMENDEIADKIELVVESDTTHKEIVSVTSLFLTLSEITDEQVIEESYQAIIPE